MQISGIRLSVLKYTHKGGHNMKKRNHNHDDAPGIDGVPGADVKVTVQVLVEEDDLKDFFETLFSEDDDESDRVQDYEVSPLSEEEYLAIMRKVTRARNFREVYRKFEV